MVSINNCFINLNYDVTQRDRIVKYDIKSPLSIDGTNILLKNNREEVNFLCFTDYRIADSNFYFNFIPKGMSFYRAGKKTDIISKRNIVWLGSYRVAKRFFDSYETQYGINSTILTEYVTKEKLKLLNLMNRKNLSQIYNHILNENDKDLIAAFHIQTGYNIKMVDVIELIHQHYKSITEEDIISFENDFKIDKTFYGELYGSAYNKLKRFSIHSANKLLSEFLKKMFKHLYDGYYIPKTNYPEDILLFNVRDSLTKIKYIDIDMNEEKQTGGGGIKLENRTATFLNIESDIIKKLQEDGIKYMKSQNKEKDKFYKGKKIKPIDFKTYEGL